ncbi:MAG: hypothetical protein KC964_29105, partial [Candidatus Omnitrophica bacterium]|nr:hypothetical protein [Candidatus Omnitrophota bacterium]
MTNILKRATRVEFDDDGTCRAYSANEDLLSEFSTPYDPEHNSQFETPITKDGRFLLMGSWRFGLLCYDVHGGELVWKKGPGKIRNIFLFQDRVISEVCDIGLQERDLKRGGLIHRYSMPSVECLFKIAKNEIFTGPKSRKYFLMRIPGFLEVRELPQSLLNPHDCTSFHIASVDRKGRNLIIWGTEEFPKRNLNKPGRQHFRRIVSIG